MRYLPRLGTAVLAAALPLTAGCVSAVKLSYKPEPLPTPWEAKKPSLFIGKISDRSNGFMVTGAMGSPKPTPLPEPLEQTLKKALTAEFQRLGIPLARSSQEADAQVQAILRDATAAWDPGFAVQDRANFKFTLIIKDRSGRVIYNDELVGNGLGTTRHAGCCPGKGPGTALNDALAKSMGQVSELFLDGDLAAQIFAAAVPGAAPVPVVSALIVSDIDELPKVSPARRKAHAVVIGIERYRQQLPPADFAAGDARLVSKYLTSVLGYPAENVVTLTNDGATRGDIEKYVGKWLSNRVEPGDEVLVYYSGHGSPNPVTGEAYLVPYDGDPAYLEQTAYPLKDLYAQLGTLPAGSVTVVVDSCFSGAGGRSVLAKGARPLVNVTEQTGLPENVAVLSAAAGNQISQSYQEMGHGLFTYFFLKGLGQQAGRGDFDLKALYKYLAPQVAKTARKEYNTEQVPQLRQSRD
ncbi:MAG: caspase family protein [Elusimicrobia bacterium]|nr:caspase family protein [Elusimicrobiota bacterium]